MKFFLRSQIKKTSGCWHNGGSGDGSGKKWKCIFLKV